MSDEFKSPKETPKGELIRFGGRTYTPRQWAEAKKAFKNVTDVQFEEWMRSFGNPLKQPKEPEK